MDSKVISGLLLGLLALIVKLVVFAYASPNRTYYVISGNFRFVYIYIYIYVCVCVCACVRACVTVLSLFPLVMDENIICYQRERRAVDSRCHKYVATPPYSADFCTTGLKIKIFPGQIFVYIMLLRVGRSTVERQRATQSACTRTACCCSGASMRLSSESVGFLGRNILFVLDEKMPTSYPSVIPRTRDCSTRLRIFIYCEYNFVFLYETFFS